MKRLSVILFPCLLPVLSGALLPGACRAQARPLFVPNYVHVHSLERLLHWAQFPVRVFVATHNSLEEQEAQSVLAGFDLWVKATGGVARYVVVNTPAEAQITVRFVSAAALRGQPGLVGTTSVSWIGSTATLQKAGMELATEEMSPEELQGVAAHEFGHALGIEGHSDDPDDLMFPTRTRYYLDDELLTATPRSVTQRDLNTLKSGYPNLFGPA